MLIDVKQFSIMPDTGKDMTANFLKLFAYLKDIDGDKEVKLEKGRYDLYCDHAIRTVTYISNTIAEREKAVPERVVPLYLEDISDLDFDGSDCEIIIHGKSSNMFLERCERVKIRNLIIDRAQPAVSQVEVLERAKSSATIRIHDDCKYIIKKGRLIFVTDNSSYAPHKDKIVWWYGESESASSPIINRTRVNPFARAKAEEIAPGVVKLKYLFGNSCKAGMFYHVHSRYREEVGIYANRCRDIELVNLHERSNYSHAFILQTCHNVALKCVSSAPDGDSGRLAASQTDCVHCSMCSGHIQVTDSRFEGAFDDVFNAHGFHFRIIAKKGQVITVKFMHPQAYGFMPFDEGDILKVIDAKTLIGDAELTVKSIKVVDKYRLQLEVDGDIDGAKVGKYIEDISKCADVTFKGNYCVKISTRGLLITTRGKAVVEDNVFDNMQMSGILISDDAGSWYESGAVRDVAIRGNKFIKCGEQAICVMPENLLFADYVHKGIAIENNEFVYDTDRAIFAKDSCDIAIRNNTFKPLGSGSQPTELRNCGNVTLENNTVVS